MNRLTKNVVITQVASATTAGGVVLVAERAGRRRVTFKNLDGSIIVYIGAGDQTVSASNGFTLLAGQSVTFETQAAFKSLSASGTPSIAVAEEY
jgi:hypothetical protein